MVTKPYTCPNGHKWQDSDKIAKCPVCGSAPAETDGNGNSHLESTGPMASSSSRNTSNLSSPSRFGRYEVIEELGRGGMGIVYRAYDPVYERQVALKTLPTNDPALLSRFKREFRVLADADHPNLVKLFELSSEGGTWFFTMEVVEGVDLLNFVRSGFNPPPVEVTDNASHTGDLTLIHTAGASEGYERRIRDGFTELAGAIAELHTSGVVHRDIKPSNVIVTPVGRVVLLDFGLLAEIDPSGMHLSLHPQVMGTAAYMSPEQAACEPVSPASDWYSVGVMLYQSLTGVLPLSGSVLEVLANKQNLDPVPPREIEPSISRDWSDLCLDMLSRDPERRPSAEDILLRLGGDPHENAHSHVSVADETSLVGRTTELQQLLRTLQTVRSGQPKCVFVKGESGMGKSALAETFIEEAARTGVVVLKGRCYEMESVPFKAIDSLVDSLVTYLSHLSLAAAAALMPRDVHALARLFPVISQVEAVSSLPRRQLDIFDQQELNRRAISALRELLARMGDRSPLVVYMDDLQWGDEDSAAMLSDLLQPPEPPVLLFLGTYRSEDEDSSQFLQSFRQIQRQRELPLELTQIEVAHLEQSDAIRLALALQKRNDSDARRSAHSIAKEAAGNPFFVSELVKHLQLDGTLVSSSIEPLVLVDMIWSRVQRLSDESQRLMAVVALAGQPLPLDQAMHIADVGQEAIGPLRSGHLIRTVGPVSSSKIETYHDRVRESVSKRLDLATRQQNHLRIAQEYARQSPISADEILERLIEYFADGQAPLEDRLDVDSTWYEIAFHFDAAGRTDLAFSYALATAEQARTQFSLEVAEQQFRIAERGAASHDDGVKYRIAQSLGDILMLRGKYDEARISFDRALKLAPDSGARIEGELGELAFKQGDMETAIERLERGLELLGHRVPRLTLTLYLKLSCEAFIQIVHSLLPGLFVGRKTLPGDEQQLLAVSLYNRLLYAYWFKGGKFPSLWTHLRGMNLAEKYPPTVELAQAYSIHAPVMNLVGLFDRGIAYAKKSFRIYESFNDLWGQGQSFHFQGHCLYAASRYEECIESCRKAVRRLERMGDYWEVNVARYHIALSHYRLGNLQAAVVEAMRMHETGLEIGDILASGGCLDVWVRAAGGQVSPEILQTELQRPREDYQASAMLSLAEGTQLFMQGRLDAAADVFDTAYKIAAGAGVKNPYVFPLLSWRASALRRRAEEITDQSGQDRVKLLNQARKVARKAVRIARTFQTDLPHALREAGVISAMRGLERRARKYLDESLDVAQRQGARFEHAQTLLARGRIGRSFDWPDAQEQVTAGRDALIELGAEFALSHPAAPE